jgi:hypothetical protein
LQIVLAVVVAAVCAEADPSLIHGDLGYTGLAGLGYTGLGYATPYVYGKSAPCVNAANIPVPCADGLYGGVYGAHLIGKRSAEAEADPSLLYSNLGYGYSGLAGLGYATPYVYGKSAPCVNAANIPVPCADGIYGSVYGARLIGKRSAEAEADPSLIHSGLGYAGLGYAGLGYAGLGYAGLGYTGLGYTHPSNLGICLNVQGVQVPC